MGVGAGVHVTRIAKSAGKNTMQSVRIGSGARDFCGPLSVN